MKLVWCPATATKAFVDTANTCGNFGESGVPELVSATAGGYNPQLTVETWYQGEVITISVGLALASQHTGSRHVCIVPDEETKSAYLAAMHEACGMSPEVIVGRVEEVVSGLSGIDFLVVDCRSDDVGGVLKLAKLGQNGAVLVLKNLSAINYSNIKWKSVGNGGPRVVRSSYLTAENGVEIVYVSSGGGSVTVTEGVSPRPSHWVRHIDEQSGEEYIYRSR